MKITAHDLVRFGVIDSVVPEPAGGAHREPAAAVAATGEAIANALMELRGLDRETIRRQRREKFLAIGRNLGRAGAWRQPIYPGFTMGLAALPSIPICLADATS